MNTVMLMVTMLNEHFETVNNGELTYFKVIRFHQKNGVIYTDQTNYVRDIAERFGMSDAKPVKTPQMTGD